MPRSPVRQVLIASLSVVLVAALAFVAFGSWLPPRQAFRGTMKDLVPQAEELPRWTLEYRPVAETAEMQKAVGEILNFDDAVYAIYDNGGLRVSIYAAYWSPGKMSHRLIAGHTPDVCWVGGGWVRRKAESLGMKIESRKEGAEERTAARGQKPDDGGQTTEDRGQLVRRSLGEGGRSAARGRRHGSYHDSGIVGVCAGDRRIAGIIAVMSDQINGFENLRVYQEACELDYEIFLETKKFPREEMYALTDQVRRSSRTIGGNIAESWAKQRYPAHFVSKLTDADGELQETQHWIGRAKAYGYVSADRHADLLARCKSVGRKLGKMIQEPDSFW